MSAADEDSLCVAIVVLFGLPAHAFEAPDYDCFGTPPKLTFNRVVPLKESADKKKLEGRGDTVAIDPLELGAVVRSLSFVRAEVRVEMPMCGRPYA